MRLLFTLLLSLVLVSSPHVNAQNVDDESWIENPLGFSPLELHTRNGLLVPAIAVTAILLLTDADTSTTDRWRMYGEMGISWGYKPPHTTMYLANIGFLFKARSWLEIGPEISMYNPLDDFNNTVGIGIRPVARFYPINSETVRVYFESGAGLVYFRKEFPQPSNDDERLGTRLNGSPKYGLGAEVKVTDNAYLLLGIRHIHISNGNALGPERNPSHDSNGFYVGMTWTSGM